MILSAILVAYLGAGKITKTEANYLSVVIHDANLKVLTPSEVYELIEREIEEYRKED